MPFDALVRPPCTLADAAFELGISPIPAEVLAEHKRTEQAKYPPASVLYPYIGYVRFGIGILSLIGLGLGILGVVNTGRLLIHPTPDTVIDTLIPCTLSVMILFATMYATTKTLRGPAEWVESTTSVFLSDAPGPMLTMALRMTSRVPDAEIVIGKLWQSNVVVDPYLLVRTRTEEVCLGIWNGDTILYQA